MTGSAGPQSADRRPQSDPTLAGPTVSGAAVPSWTTPRLTVRAFRPGDAGALQSAGVDPEVVRWTGIPVPFTEADALELITTIYPQRWADGSACTFGTFRRDSEALVSCVSVVPGRFDVYEIGYWTAPDQRGAGLTSEGVRSVLRWTFAELGAQRIEWQGIIGNTASWRLAQDLGFRFEGTTRSRITQRGERADTWIGGLLRAEFDLGRGEGPATR